MSFFRKAIWLAALFPMSAFSQEVKVNHVNCAIPERHYEIFQRYLNHQIAFYNDFFPVKKDISVNAYVLGDMNSYKVFGMERSHGTYSPDANHIYIYKSSAYLSVFSHELSHWMAAEHLHPLPQWINEGLAECFQHYLVKDARTIFYPDKYHWDAITKKLKGGFDLKRWLRYSRAEFYEPDSKSDNYAVAWGVVYFLYQKDPGILKSILLHLGKKRGVSRTAFNKYYPGGYTAFAQDFFDFFTNQYPFEYYEKGRSFFEEKSYGKALSYFALALEQAPYFPYAYFYSGLAAERGGLADSADFFYEKAITLAPDMEATIFLTKASYDFEELNYDECIANYSRFLQYGSKEEMSDAFTTIGLCYNFSMRYDQSVSAYRKAIELDPEDPTNYNNLSFVYLLLEEYDSAILFSDAAIKLGMELGNPYAHRGYAYLKKGELEKCRKDLAEAIRKSPAYANAYYYRGIFEEERGNVEFAIADWKLALGLSENAFITYLVSKRLEKYGFGAGELAEIYARRKWKRAGGDETLAKDKYAGEYRRIMEVTGHFDRKASAANDQ